MTELENEIMNIKIFLDKNNPSKKTSAQSKYNLLNMSQKMLSQQT